MPNSNFYKKNRFLLSYGLLLAFLSSFGQTFIIALYVPNIQKTFNLSDTGFSSIYGGATIMAALTLTWTGRYIDKVNIIKYTLFVLTGICFSVLLFSQAYYLPILFIALFGVRLFGQGLLTHTSVTSMARFFNEGRGKAMSFASLGHPLGEILLPLLIVSSIYGFGWRITLLLSAVLLVACVPLLIFLLRNNTNFSQLRNYIPKKFTQAETIQAKPLQIMQSKFFWMIMPSTLVAASFGTGFLLFKLKLGLSYNWTPTFVAIGFTAYSICSAFANLLAGFLTDKYSGKKMFVFYLLPSMLGYLCLYFFSDQWVYIILMGSIGASNGFGSTVKNVVLAELYGTKTIGSVRSLFTTIMVFSTALGPFLFGILLDANIAFSSIAGIAFLVFLLTSFNAVRLFRLPN